MHTIQQSVRVDFQFPVSFTTDLFAPENPAFAAAVGRGGVGDQKKALCVIDAGVVRHHPNLPDRMESYLRHHGGFLRLAGAPLIVEGGEDVKNDRSRVRSIHRAVDAFGVDRHSYVIAIGGGAVIDMAGYAAATAHRGVRLVRVPTTVLSQNDSAVGVKNGVNAFGKKNFEGTFAPPYAVINDSDFLRTLSDRDWLGGVSEAIKVALLKDVSFFGFIEEHAEALVRRDMRAMEWVVYRCAELHLQHIASGGDPFELGSSRPLDFGHWSAHKLEQLSGYRLRHGEAVAVGLALDSTYSYLKGLLHEGEWRRILRLITSLDLAVYTDELGLRAPDHGHRVLEGLNEFREHLGGRLTVMLLRSIGEGFEVHDIEEGTMIEAVELLKKVQAARMQGGGHGGAYVPACPASTG